MDFLDLDPIARVAGTATMPGSKSISNRVLLLAALARGETVVHDALDADDTRVMLAALRALGVAAMSGSSPEIRIQGCGGAFPVRSADLFLGNDYPRQDEHRSPNRTFINRRGHRFEQVNLGISHDFDRQGVPIPSISTTTKPSSASDCASPRATEKLRPPTLPVCGPG